MILVTGATGTTGREVLMQLTARGVRVRAFVRNPDRAVALDGPLVEIVRGDLERPETLSPALKGVDAVFLLSSPDPRQAELQGNLVEAAPRAGIRRLVKMSVLGADPASPASLPRWHGETERQIEASGIPYTHLRPNLFMQALLMHAPSVARDGAIYAPVKDGKVSVVDTRDIAAVAVAALTEDGHEAKAYDITGPEALSYADMAARLSSATGKTVTHVDVAPEEARKGMLAAGMPEWLADALLQLYAIFREGRAAAVTNVVAVVAKKRPRTFDEFAREAAAAFGGAH